MPLFKAELAGYVIIRTLQIAFIVHLGCDASIRQYALKQKMLLTLVGLVGKRRKRESL